jgi:hypothetical protein
MEEQMRKFTLVLATLSCAGLVTPAFANERGFGSSSGHAAKAEMSEKGKVAIDEASAAKKKKKKPVANRSSWGG